MKHNIKDQNLICSFCSVNELEVDFLVEGEGVYICDKCGLIVGADEKNNKYECKNCNNFTNIHKVNIPYTCKLLMQELQTMSIAPRLITDHGTENPVIAEHIMNNFD